MNILWVLVTIVFVIFIEKRNLKNHWNKKEAILFFAALFIGSSLCMAWVLKTDLANPLEIIAKIYRPIAEPITTRISQYK